MNPRFAAVPVTVSPASRNSCRPRRLRSTRAGHAVDTVVPSMICASPADGSVRRERDASVPAHVSVRCSPGGNVTSGTATENAGEGPAVLAAVDSSPPAACVATSAPPATAAPTMPRWCRTCRHHRPPHRRPRAVDPPADPPEAPALVAPAAPAACAAVSTLVCAMVA